MMVAVQLVNSSVSGYIYKPVGRYSQRLVYLVTGGYSWFPASRRDWINSQLRLEYGEKLTSKWRHIKRHMAL